MSDSELTLRENLVFRNILSFFRACPQQHVSSLCSIEINRFAIWFSLYRTHVILQISVLLKFTNNIKGKYFCLVWYFNNLLCIFVLYFCIIQINKIQL